MLIRPADKTDIAAVQAIAEAAFAVHAPVIGRRPAPMDADFAQQVSAGQLFVIERPAAAYACWYPRGDHIHLDSLAVAPNHQGKGLGQALIAGAKDAARRAGLAAVELYTNAAMTGNLALYQRLGFEVIARKRVDGFDRVYFRKDV